MDEKPQSDIRAGFIEAPGPKRRRSDIVKVIERSLERTKRPGSVTVSVTRDLTDPLVWIDREQIIQTLVSLATNAVEAMPAGGVLAIDVRGDEQRIVITIKDTGKGIPPEHMDQLFIPYFTTKTAGAGLGIPLAYAAVKSHGGAFVIESNADGDQGPTGTRVTITLPRGRPAAPAAGRLIIHDD
ncbi:MAG: ATP-binding protein [Syntrophaceae bacterium]